VGLEVGEVGGRVGREGGDVEVREEGDQLGQEEEDCGLEDEGPVLGLPWAYRGELNQVVIDLGLD
jgi:hypothetical protein